MIKKSLVAAGLLFASTSAMAQNENFVSAGFGNGSLTGTANIKTTAGVLVASSTSEESGGILSVMGGTIIDKTHKVILGYSTYNTEAGLEIDSIDFGYNYFINQNVLGITEKKLKPFVGVAYSMITYTSTLGNTYNYDKSSLTAEVNTLLLSLGADYEIDKKQFITFSYDMPICGSGSDSTNFSSGGTDYVLELEIEKASRWLLSYNYKF